MIKYPKNKNTVVKHILKCVDCAPLDLEMVKSGGYWWFKSDSLNMVEITFEEGIHTKCLDGWKKCFLKLFDKTKDKK